MLPCIVRSDIECQNSNINAIISYELWETCATLNTWVILEPLQRGLPLLLISFLHKYDCPILTCNEAHAWDCGEIHFIPMANLKLDQLIVCMQAIETSRFPLLTGLTGDSM